MEKKKILWVNRKKRKGAHSMERVFHTLKPHLSKTFDIEEVDLPLNSSGIFSIIYNAIWLSFKRANICHILGEVHYVLLFLKKGKHLLTIHDCNFLHNYSGLKRVILKWLFLDMPVRRAGIIHTISEKSKAEILEYTSCDPQKIIVIPNPVVSNFRKKSSKSNSSAPKFLFIGSTENKNLSRVIQALSGVDGHLTIVGNISEENIKQLEANKIQYSNLSHLTNEELEVTYQNNDVLLFPSTYEGFGLPILEAQQVGLLVITSNIQPLTFVAGDAAVFVDPYQVSEIKNALENIHELKIDQQGLIEKGFVNVQRFHPETVATGYIKLYTEIVGSENKG